MNSEELDPNCVTHEQNERKYKMKIHCEKVLKVMIF